MLGLREGRGCLLVVCLVGGPLFRNSGGSSDGRGSCGWSDGIGWSCFGLERVQETRTIGFEGTEYGTKRWRSVFLLTRVGLAGLCARRRGSLADDAVDDLP